MADDKELREAGVEALKNVQTVLTTSPEEHRIVENPSPTKAADALAKAKDAEAEDLESNTEPTPEGAEQLKAQKKARVAQVLQRGILNSKLQAVYEACVPKGRKGKYIRDDGESVIRYGNLFYTFEYTEGAVKRYGSPDGRIRVGSDLVLMTISQEDREILREVKQDRIMKNLGKGRKEYTTKADQAAREGGAPVPFDESTSNVN